MQVELSKLKIELSELQEELNLYKCGKSSQTSSTPPSHDIGRSNAKSLREKTGRKVGGQLGHKGSTLEMTDLPDKIVEHKPSSCNECGDAFDDVPVIFLNRKQEIDIPIVKPIYTEHRSFACRCKCGHLQEATLPERLKANIQYGPTTKAYIGYLSACQYMPHKRLTKILNNFFNLPISPGTVHNILKDLYQKALPIYRTIQDKISKETVIGGDESGTKIEGKKGWCFVFQSATITFIAMSFSRGYETIANLFKDGFPFSTYVSDCLAAQLKVKAKFHQICLAHLLRELQKFIEALNCNWSKEMKKLFLEAYQLKKELTENDYYKSNPKIVNLQDRLDKLLTESTDGKHKKLKAFIKRLVKNKNHIFTFLYHQKVPPDNNTSEQAIRNVKIKTKVSTHFRTKLGADIYAVLRTIIDTSLKNQNDPIEAIKIIAVNC